MSRELRRVPPNWEHPKDARGEYIPLLDGDYRKRAKEWKEALAAWERGERPDWVLRNNPERYLDDDGLPMEYWEAIGSNPPDRDSYRPYTDEEATWFQLYEGVSEGTPITPPFATKEELVEYLVESGDWWGNFWSRKRATEFVEEGFALSGESYAGGRIFAPHEDRE